jgi:cation diffusion facilitator CzcD-associated flavoprotein CzcO
MATTLDREALRAKYRRERDKRLREDGNEQYLEPTGRYAHLLDDPYVTPATRAPVHTEVEVAVIGGGFAGLTTGARLKEAGVTDVHLIEGGGDVGGAWYWNRYPGAMCDTAAMIYLPLLEETGYRPTHKYAFAPDIFGHARRIAETFGLYDDALLSTSVTELRWDEPSSRWIVRTDRGDDLRARFVATGCGPLHRPKLPGIPGIQTFAGHAFHTSRWDYGYTGGDWTGAPMDRLGDKRVGIIGTGATGVQCIPHLARSAGELYVFQRTPSSIDVRGNHEIDPGFFEELEPGWQREWLLNFATVQTGGVAEVDLVQDGWTDIAKRIRGRIRAAREAGDDTDRKTLMAAFADSDDEKMNEIRARVDAVVRDPATAERLKPWYRQLCKRPCFHDEYLDAYNHPNTHLVDTDGLGVERIDETGCWVGGEHYELDCLIFASGFEVGTPHTRRNGFEAVGRDGLSLTDYWTDGMRTLHGMHVHNFPNLFVLGGAQAGNLISNVTSNLTEAASTVAAVVAHASATGAEQVEVSEEAEEAWVRRLDGMAPMLANPDCTPGYYNNEGKPLAPRDQLGGVGYPEGPVAFFHYIDAWRRSGDFAGLDFRPGQASGQ